MAGVKTLVFVLTGALLGIAIASLVVPPALSWYSTPGGLPQGAQIQALVQIPEVIRYSTGRLIRGQLIGAAIGAIRVGTPSISPSGIATSWPFCSR
jgi:hypothetical protein